MPTAKKIPPTTESGTRDRILQVAIDLFSERGFDGVSVNDIVAAAGVNKRMVYHYFENKAGLYQEALFFAYRELSEFEEARIGDAESLTEIVKRLVGVYFEFPRLHPRFTQLMLWENLSKGQHIKNTRARLSKKNVVNRLKAAIKREADDGTWRSDLDARELLVTILGVCQIYASHRYTLSQALHIDLGSPKAIKTGKANAELFLFAGMRPSARGE